MKKEELASYVDAYKIKIPKRNSISIHVYGKNLDNVKSHLNQPYDRVFTSIMEETMKIVAPTIDGCFAAYTVHNDFVFLLNNDEGKTPFMNNDIQRIASIVSSQITITFHRLFMAFNIEYEEKISQINSSDESREELIEINERLTNLWNAVSEVPVFYAEVFTLPEEDQWAMIEQLQTDNINRTIEAMSRLYMDKTEGLSHRIILTVLRKKNVSWFDMPTEYRYGITFTKNNIDGKNIWTNRPAYFEKAIRYENLNKFYK